MTNNPITNVAASVFDDCVECCAGGQAAERWIDAQGQEPIREASRERSPAKERNRDRDRDSDRQRDKDRSKDRDRDRDRERNRDRDRR